MTDYSELVKDLRDTERICRDRMDGKVMLDAAAAIEALQAEIRESMQKCAECGDEQEQKVKELQARLGEAENSVERWKDMYLTKNEPKRGKWIETEEMEWGIYPFKKKTCSVCDCKIDHTFMLACMDYFDDRDTVFHYCPNCGAKMEVQE